MMKEHPLRQYLDWSGIPVARLARRVGTSRQTVHRVMSGMQTPSLDLVSRLIAATNGAVSADDFLPRSKETAQ